MPFNASLAYLVDSVNEQLGDAAPLIPDESIERWVNEGQRRYEPDLLLPSVATGITWADRASSAALPTDLAEVVRFLPATGKYHPPEFALHGTTIHFLLPDVVRAFSGTILYLAHFPAITTDDPCQLPETAIDGLVSFALYRAYKRIASNRVQYKKYSTLVNNQTSVADLVSMASDYLADFEDSRTSAAAPRQAEGFYSS